MNTNISSINISVQARRRTVVTINLPTALSSTPPIHLDNLCHSIQQATSGSHFLDLYLSQDSYLSYQHKAFNAGDPRKVTESSKDIISLEEALQRAMQSNEPSPIQWTLNQRMALSFNVASSVMQLHSTPWLCFPLTSETLCFPQNKKSFAMKGTAQFMEIPEPFIQQSFLNGKDDPTSKCACNPRRSMLELGIILLELWHAKAFKTYATEQGLELSDKFGCRYDVVKRWLDISVYHILPFYLEVVTRCIECTFASDYAAFRWDDIVFRKSVCEYVLKPLWENCPAEFR